MAIPFTWMTSRCLFYGKGWLTMVSILASCSQWRWQKPIAYYKGMGCATFHTRAIHGGAKAQPPHASTADSAEAEACH
jgi:hypothetical protein